MDQRLITLPASTIVLSAFGAVAHVSYNWVDTWQAGLDRGPRKPLAQKLLDSPWLPFKPLPDRDYEALLREKLLGVDADIAMIDDKIGKLRHAASQSAERSWGP